MANEETADYGPLLLLIGTWKGDKGMDVAPKQEGQEENLYYETIVFEKAGDVDNADTQTLAIVRYHLFVKEKANDEVSHDQVGYWLWDKENETIIHSLTIPRGVSVIAGGKFEAKNNAASSVSFNVEAKVDGEWGIVQSPFMKNNAQTIEFTQELTVNANELRYSQTMVLDIYGRIFRHTDENSLTKV
jgi:hypothetical protein